MPDDKKPAARAAERRLKAEQDAERRRKMGPALKLREEALAAAAAISASDIASAEAYWDMLAPPEARGLLGATRVEPDA